jgi:hypothetical protein
MPQREKYFAQPPLELLRQWFDHGGWYERKPPCAFRTTIDTQFVGSMGPPGVCAGGWATEPSVGARKRLMKDCVHCTVGLGGGI